MNYKETPLHARKDAVLITKLLQTVSNGVEFDESREGNLFKLNPFIRKNRLFVDVFFDSLTVRLFVCFYLILDIYYFGKRIRLAFLSKGMFMFHQRNFLKKSWKD